MACCGKRGSTAKSAVATKATAAVPAAKQLIETSRTIQVRVNAKAPYPIVRGNPTGAVYRPSGEVLTIYKRDLEFVLAFGGGNVFSRGA